MFFEGKNLVFVLLDGALVFEEGVLSLCLLAGMVLEEALVCFWDLLAIFEIVIVIQWGFYLGLEIILKRVRHQ